MAEQHDPGQFAGDGRLLDRGGVHNAANRSKSRGQYVAAGAGGRLLVIDPTAADAPDVAGVRWAVATMHERWTWPLGEKDVEVLPRRRVVECASGWMPRWRRLVRCRERRCNVSEPMTRAGVGALPFGRVAHA